ncbi:MAG: NAD-dependent epimerase/dehydratase family protein [Xanthobacteraceae bacterium]
MRILLTGGAGCLGSNLAERWLERGVAVLIIDNFATGHRGNLPASHANLTIVEGHVADKPLVDRVFSDFNPTHVVHCAAAYSDPGDWVEDARTNVEGSIHVMKAALAAGVQRFLNFQTALAYGRPDNIPIPVDHPVRPFTSYGISKAAGERYLMLSSLPYVSLRLANVTGPRLAIGPIPTFYKRLSAGQKCFCSRTERDFVDMEDFFSIVDLAMAPGATTGVFNVSTGTGHTIREIFDLVAAHFGIQVKEPPLDVDPAADDVPAVVLDPAQTTKAFGWRAKYDFEQTVSRTLKWYDKHGVTAIFSHLKPPDKTH